MDPILALARVRFLAHDRSVLLDGLDVRVFPGERVAIVGPENCGKTVLLQIMAGLLLPAAGTVQLEGRPLAAWSTRERARRVGFLFRHPEAYFLAPTVWEEIALGVAHLGLVEPALTHRVVAAMTDAGLDPGLRETPIAHLTASRRARVALAAVLACQPRLLLADEPGSQLSDQGEADLAKTFSQLCQQQGMAMVLATSRLARAQGFGQHLLELHGGCLHPLTPPTHSPATVIDP